MTKKETDKLTLTHTFHAPIEKVWEAFTTPSILEKWWAPPGMESSDVSVDLKEGGRFLFCFKAANGIEFWGKGEYQSIDRPSFLSYWDTFADPEGNSVPPSHYGMEGDKILSSLVEVSLDNEEGITGMTMVMDNHYDEKMTNGLIAGWNGMFQKLDQIL